MYLYVCRTEHTYLLMYAPREAIGHTYIIAARRKWARAGKKEKKKKIKKKNAQKTVQHGGEGIWDRAASSESPTPGVVIYLL